MWNNNNSSPLLQALFFISHYIFIIYFARLAVQTVRAAELGIFTEKYDVLELYGEESLSQPRRFYIKVNLLTNVEYSTWLGSAAILNFKCGAQIMAQKNLCVAAISVTSTHHSQQLLAYITLKSHDAMLSHLREAKVYLEQSRPDVMRALLTQRSLYQAQQVFFHCVRQQPSLPMILQIMAESDLQFLQRLCRESHLFYWHDKDAIHLADHVYLCPQLDAHYALNINDGLLFQFEEVKEENGIFYQAKSYVPLFTPGFRVDIDEQQYIIYHVIHHYCQQRPYHNQLLLKKVDEYVVEQPHQTAVMPWCFLATVESCLPSPFVDQAGRYKCRFHYISQAHDKTKNSSFIPKAQFYGGEEQSQKIGMHFPCHDGEVVLVTCLDGDIYQPIILGALSQPQQAALVSDDNVYENILRSKNGCGLQANPKQKSLSLFAPQSQLTFTHQTITAIAQQGVISIQANKNITYHIQQQYQLKVNGHYKIAAQDLCFQQSQGKNYWQCSENVSYLSQAQLNFSVIKMALRVDKGFNLSGSETTGQMCAANQTIQVKSTASLSANQLEITADNVIQLHTGCSSLTLLKDAIEIYAKTVEFDFNDTQINAQSCHIIDNVTQQFKPQVQASLPLLPAMQAKSQATRALIRQCRWSQPRAHVGDKVQVFAELITVSADETIQLQVYYAQQLVDQQQYTVREVMLGSAGDNIAVSLPWVVKTPLEWHDNQQHIIYHVTLALSDGAKHTSTQPLALVVDLSVSLTYQGVVPYTQPVVLTLEDAKHCRQNIHLQLGEGEFEDVHLQNISLQLLQQEENNRYTQRACYQAKGYPQPIVKQTLKHTLHQAQTSLKILPDLQYLRIKDNLSYATSERQFFDASKQALFATLCRDQPKNITLFIHGFNVAAGETGFYIDDINYSWFAENDLSITFSDITAQIYQSYQQLCQQFPLIKKDKNFMTQYEINGRGDIAWLLAMEYFVNLGQGLKHKGYDFYQRIIGIFWPAIADSVLDYMQVAERVINIGKKLSLLLADLLEQGFEVNIIAHSLGNGVLLQALNHLAQNKEQQGKVNYCFMWEAAVPNNVFSRQSHQQTLAATTLKMQSDPWYVPYAKEAAKHFVVLHSQNDNVLGAIPAHQPCPRGQFYVNAQKPYFEELVPAVLLTYLGLESVYNVAMVLKLPISMLIEKQNMTVFYEVWRQHYHPVYDKSKRLFPATLDERVAQLKKNEESVTKQIILRRFKQHENTIYRYLNAANPTASHFDYLCKTILLFVFAHAGGLEEMAKAIKRGSDSGFGTMGINYYQDQAADDLSAQRFWVLIHSIFYDNTLHYPSALGYSGVVDDAQTQAMLASGQLQQVDQSAYLFSHSAMKNPSPDVFKHVFQEVFNQSNNDYHFGGY